MKKHIVGYMVLGVLAIGASSATAASLISGAQVRNNSLTGLDVRSSSLNGTDIANGSIGPSDLSARAKTAGPPGPAGIANVTVVEGAEVPVASGEVGGATATCPAGSVVVGTGFNASVGVVGFVERFGSVVGMAVVNDLPVPIAIHAQAICASGPGITAPATVRSVTSDDGFEKQLAEFRKAHQR